MKRILLISFVFLFLITGVFAQAPKEPNILSPNTASLSSFGNVPVNHFVGSPNISVPLYNVSIGKISVPIALSYNKELVKPANVPGWVGFGWNLSSGGVITRKVNGKPDEFIDEYSPAYLGFIEAGKTYLDDIAATNGAPYEYDHLISYFNNTDGAAADMDLEADEFTFNFLGYSGRFFYMNSTEGFVAFSDDEHIKVELTGYAYEIGADIVYDRVFPDRVSVMGGHSIKGFRLTVANGTVFTFGGRTSSMEFSNDYMSNINTYDIANLIVDAWYLTEIEDVDGNKVIFNYQKNVEPICRVGHSLHQVISASYSYYFNNCSGSGSIPIGYGVESAKYVDYCDKQGRVIFPVYLSQILSYSSDHESFDAVSFTSSATNSLTYTNKYLHRDHDADDANDNYFQHSWISSIPFKWHQLDEIEITKHSNHKEKFEFSFDPSSGNFWDQKLTLYSIRKYNSDGIATYTETEQYNFEYNLFGYTNYDMLGKDVDKFGFATASGSGLISKMTYPTKGYTIFEWEGNKYSKYINTDRHSWVNTLSSGLSVGGYRIESIKHYDLNGVNPLKHLTYAYLNTDNRSSGILNGDATEVYDFDVSPRYPTDHNGNYPVNISFTVRDANGLTNYSNNGQSHIGYSRVIETDVTSDATKTYTYSNFGGRGEDGGREYYDRSMNSYIGWKAGEDQYQEMTPIGDLLGKLLKVEEQFGIYTKTTKFEYHEFDNRQLPYFRIKMTNSYNFILPIEGVCYPGGNYGCSITFAASIAERHKRNKMSSKTEIFTAGGEQTKVSEYYYNFDGLLFSEVTVLDDNERYYKFYSYPIPEGFLVFEGDEPSYWEKLINKYNAHILSEPYFIETIYENFDTEITEVTQANYLDISNTYPYRNSAIYNLDKEGISKLSKDLNRYDLYFPATDLDFYLQDGTLKKEAEFDYDVDGNLIMIKKEDDLINYFFWAYDKKIPIAKIVTNDELTITETFRSSLLNKTDSERRATIENQFSSYDIMLYTYTSSIPVGLKSETDPSGKTIYYEYDFAGRLKNIKDHNHHLLKSFEYHKANSAAY